MGFWPDQPISFNLVQQVQGQTSFFIIPAQSSWANIGQDQKQPRLPPCATDATVNNHIPAKFKIKIKNSQYYYYYFILFY
jgi:hypothetical protein